MNDESNIRAQLKTWIASNSAHADAKTIEDSTPILERRIITSLQVMDLILFVEQLREQPIDPEVLKPGVFSSVDAIYACFFATR